MVTFFKFFAVYFLMCVCVATVGGAAMPAEAFAFATAISAVFGAAAAMSVRP